MDKTQIMIWKQIGYKAQDIICMADAGFPIENIKQCIDSLRTIIGSLDWTIVNKIDTKRERLRGKHLLKSQFFFVGRQVSI